MGFLTLAVFIILISATNGRGSERNMLEIGQMIDRSLRISAVMYPKTNGEFRNSRVFENLFHVNQNLASIPGLSSVPGFSALQGILSAGMMPCPLEVIALGIKLASPQKPPPPPKEREPCTWQVDNHIIDPDNPMAYLRCEPSIPSKIVLPIPQGFASMGIPLPIPGLNPESLLEGLITADIIQPPLPNMDLCGALKSVQCPNGLYFNVDEGVCAYSPGGGPMGLLSGMVG
ncbi:Histidine--tRNA ligase [Trichinella pseudospiralis]